MTSQSELPPDFPPTYEVNFVERPGPDGQFEKLWTSVMISGFNEETSRHRQVEELLGAIGNQALEGDFSMRLMKPEEVEVLHTEGTQPGGTTIFRTQTVDGLIVRIAYPAGADLERVRDHRREVVASSMRCAEAIREGVIISRELFNPDSDVLTEEDADAIEAELRGQHGLLYGDDSSAEASAGPPTDN